MRKRQCLRPLAWCEGEKVYVNVHEELRKRCRQYPLYSQAEHPDPVACAKLLFPAVGATWYITGYMPEEQLAIGYVRGKGVRGWSQISIAQMTDIRILGQAIEIEVDLSYRPMPLSILGVFT